MTVASSLEPPLWAAPLLALFAATAAILVAPAPAHADAGAGAGVCRGAPPAAGAVFRGPVLHVPDGRTVCVARGFNPDRWIALRLDDAPPATARATLMAVAFGKDVDCSVSGASQAHCTLDGRSLGALAAEPAAATAGLAWREASEAGHD